MTVRVVSTQGIAKILGVNLYRAGKMMDCVINFPNPVAKYNLMDLYLESDVKEFAKEFKSKSVKSSITKKDQPTELFNSIIKNMKNNQERI